MRSKDKKLIAIIACTALFIIASIIKIMDYLHIQSILKKISVQRPPIKQFRPSTLPTFKQLATSPDTNNQSLSKQEEPTLIKNDESLSDIPQSNNEQSIDISEKLKLTETGQIELQKNIASIDSQKEPTLTKNDESFSDTSQSKNEQSINIPEKLQAISLFIKTLKVSLKENWITS